MNHKHLRQPSGVKLKYVGYRDQTIIMVSDHPIKGNYSTIPLPVELELFSAEDLILNFQVQDGKFFSKLQIKTGKNLKVAVVSNWKMACGIATYAEHLLEKLIPKLGEVKIFSEIQDTYTGLLNLACGLQLNDAVIPCWKRGQNLLQLVKEIKNFNPDIVLINHEWGLFPNARYWLSMMTQLSNYRIITIIHSTFYHADKTIVEASLPELIIHQIGGKDVLENTKQISGKIHLIPHGCYEYQPGHLWNFYRTPQTFIQVGFGLRYKRFEDSVQAAFILKEKYPNIFFTGIFSESPYAKVAHQMYFVELLNLVKKLNLEENVAIIRGFQSDTVINSYLRTNAVAVFPYGSDPKHEVWGSSGAARLAMSKGLPVITANHNHFSDLPTLKANGPEGLAQTLDQLFSDPEFKKQQIQAQIDFIQNNSWEITAQKFIGIFES